MKNTIKALTLTTAFLFGSTVAMANGGIIIGDRSVESCVKETATEGIIIGDRATGVLAGIMASLEGIIIGDRSQKSCEEKRDGIIIGDRDGIIIGDRAGIIIGD